LPSPAIKRSVNLEALRGKPKRVYTASAPGQAYARFHTLTGASISPAD